MSSLKVLEAKTTVTSSPWAKIATPPTIVHSLEDVMSEQLANDLQEKETIDYLKHETALLDQAELQLNAIDTDSKTDKLAKNLEEVVENDYLLAQLLQLELDKEYDEVLKLKEKHQNKNSRVAVSLDNFKSVHPIIDKAEKDLNSLHQPELTSSSESEDELEKITFKRGVHGKGDQMISKHDLLLTSRRNASKVMKFPPEFETGDSHAIDMRLSNKVFNTLKVHSMHEEKRNNRLNDKKDQSTNEMSLDPKTRLILFKLINADILAEIGGVISTGKEATIFYAPGGTSQETLVPKHCVAKVFKTTLNEFKTREKYIGDDYRFKDRYKHLNPRKIVKLWAEKEMHNLMKMKRLEINCPDVVILKKHVLIMSLIGDENQPAPKLKDANLSPENLQIAYEQCIQLIHDLYHKCNLVHADFNQFNLLWHENKVWVIDVSQSVEPIHPMGLEFLLRDCTNIHKFFTNRKLSNVKTGEEIFNEVTNMNFKGEGEFFLSQIQKYTKDKYLENNTSLNKDPNQPYNFDYHFEKNLNLLKSNKEEEEEDVDSDSDEN